MRNSLIACAAAGAMIGVSLIAQQAPPPDAQEPAILPVHGSIYMIAGAGGNIAVSAGKDGVLLVDTGTTEMSEKVLAAVQRLQRQLQLREPPVDLHWGPRRAARCRA